MTRRLVTGLGALGALGAFWAWGRRESESLVAIRRDAEQRLAPLRRDKIALERVEPSPVPMRPLLVAYAEALAFLETTLPALDLEGATERPKGGVAANSTHVQTTEWPEIKSVDIAVAFTFWTFAGVVALLDAFFGRYPASLNTLSLTDTKGSLVLTLYGEGADRGGRQTGAEPSPS